MHTQELPLPPAAKEDSKARELIRVWAATGKQHISLATGLWADPGTWGIMLVDMARHLARAYEQSNGLDQADTLERIRAVMEAEWKTDTDPDRLGGLNSRV